MNNQVYLDALNRDAAGLLVARALRNKLKITDFCKLAKLGRGLMEIEQAAMDRIQRCIDANPSRYYMPESKAAVETPAAAVAGFLQQLFPGAHITTKLITNPSDSELDEIIDSIELGPGIDEFSNEMEDDIDDEPDDFLGSQGG